MIGESGPRDRHLGREPIHRLRRSPRLERQIRTSPLCSTGPDRSAREPCSLRGLRKSTGGLRESHRRFGTETGNREQPPECIRPSVDGATDRDSPGNWHGHRQSASDDITSHRSAPFGNERLRRRSRHTRRRRFDRQNRIFTLLESDNPRLDRFHLEVIATSSITIGSAARSPSHVDHFNQEPV